MRGPHLERLIDYIDGGGNLDSYNDVPSDIRRDLALESQIGRKSKKTDTMTTPHHFLQPSLMSYQHKTGPIPRLLRLQVGFHLTTTSSSPGLAKLL
jgi:hypothetical protein